MAPSNPRHFLQFRDFSRDEFDHLFERTRWIKARFKQYELYQPLRDRTLAMVFEKASTRTRVSFEALLDAADRALYEAKDAGRDRILVAGTALAASGSG